MGKTGGGQKEEVEELGERVELKGWVIGDIEEGKEEDTGNPAWANWPANPFTICIMPIMNPVIIEKGSMVGRTPLLGWLGP